ncbi:sensor histidine kinase [Segetibacter koreensis]|uniref:sensor histidine kinase n=1 Tax=Segetibacter koreensis TaxID=398037 RepID=UPI00037202B0|nr:histidine kinase [Segetibacter koreensis]
MIILITGLFSTLLLGTIGMLLLAITLIVFIIFHQRRVILYQLKMQQMEAEQQKVLLRASIELQEEERRRIAADLHDDAGPLLATARLYLSENMVNLDKPSQLQTIFSIKEIIDDAIQLIRNISHSLMPPTLKDFGLESAVNDFFQKINASGSINVKCCFNDYTTRLKAEKELIIFRVIQELINNIFKHSNSSFIHLTEDNEADKIIITLLHDGKGLTQEDFIQKSKSSVGLGLKNIQSRLKVIFGNIYFEQENNEFYYKVTIEVPKEPEEK